MKVEHIFDILGIGGREDSYTDLIAYSFKTLPEFKTNLLAKLSVPDYGDWIVKTRLPVAIKSNKGRKKDIPDMLMISKKGSSIILIENKIFSGEGGEQTHRYSSKELKSSLTQYLNENRIIDSHELNMKYFYLTLDSDDALSTTFEPLNYYSISECIPDNLGNSKRDILLQELKERVNEYYDWKPPQNEDVIIKYLKSAERLVTPKKAFHTMVKHISIDESFTKEYYITGNRGSSYIPACQWYKKPQWRGTNCKTVNNGHSCFEINLDFQWDVRYDSFDLFLEYTTCPYQTRKELKAYNETFLKEYQQQRNLFFEHVNNSDIGNWELKKTPLRIAKFNFDKNITFGELKQNISDLTSTATEIIDEWFQKKHYLGNDVK